MGPQDMFRQYYETLKGLPGVTCEHRENSDKESWVFRGTVTNSLEVALYLWKRGASFVGLDVKGVDSGYWHTAEEKTLDYHVELAKAALLGQVAYARSPIFRFKEVCFKVGNAWECTLTDRAGSYHYIKTRKNIKPLKS